MFQKSYSLPTSQKSPEIFFKLIPTTFPVVLQFFCKIGFYAKTHIWLKTEGRVSVQTG